MNNIQKIFGYDVKVYHTYVSEYREKLTLQYNNIDDIVIEVFKNTINEYYFFRQLIIDYLYWNEDDFDTYFEEKSHIIFISDEERTMLYYAFMKIITKIDNLEYINFGTEQKLLYLKDLIMDIKDLDRFISQ